MSQTLYRKYRPKNFSEVFAQSHIVRTLTNTIKTGRIGQAYLFTGPRGTGKTSIARILAKAVNCLEAKDAISCEKCAACTIINDGKSLDIIEIDAASNTGVDNIRELRETITLPPTSLRYKVYIIDEVHMLSTGAFNALLKTLEEPPAHVLFILATTEIHKVPETIISRCQRFDFSRLPIDNIIEKLSFIAKEEKVKISKEALEMIAISAEGGMRDAESLLGQIISLEDKNITVSEVEEILGTTNKNFSSEFVEMLITNDSTKAISKINELLRDGYDLEIFTKTLINYLRQLMLLSINPELKSNFSFELTSEQLEKMTSQTKRMELSKIILAINLFLEAQSKIYSFVLPQLPLEIAIIKITATLPAPQNEKNSLPKLSAPQETDSSSTVVSQEKKTVSEQKIAPNSPIESNKETETPQNQEPLGNAEISLEDVQLNWPALVAEVSNANYSLKALLRTCHVEGIKGREVIIATTFDFYREKIAEPKNRLTIEETFSKLLRSKVVVRAVLAKENSAKKAEGSSIIKSHLSDESAASHEQNSLLSAAMEIMGGTIVQE